MTMKVQTDTIRRFTLELTMKDLIGWLKRKHGVPQDAEVFVRVPTGADWSGCKLSVDQDAPLCVQWETIENEEEVSS